MKRFKSTNFILMVLILSFLMACSDGSYDGSYAGSYSNRVGTLSLGLTDAPTNDVKAVYVTINEVQVHSGNEVSLKSGKGNWDVVATPNKTYNLIELANGIIEELGITELVARHYTQLRLIIGDAADDGTNIFNEAHPFSNYIIDQSDIYHELKIPSGYQTGIKIVHGFNIAEDQVTELVLDFDASKSVIKAGSSGKWILKPTIKVIDMQVTGMVGGIVSDELDAPIESVSVSAQIYYPGSKDQVMIQAQSLTASDGSYSMYLWPGIYNIVLYTDGYSVACKKIEVESGYTYTEDFSLIMPTDSGTVEGTVTIQDDVEDQSAELSFRQSATCVNNIDPETIEVITINVADPFEYILNLPVGTYSLVATTEEKDTQKSAGIEIEDGQTTTVDVSFD